MAYVYASKNLVIIGSANVMLPVQHQAISKTNADKLWIGKKRTTLSYVNPNTKKYYKKMDCLQNFVHFHHDQMC